MKIWILLIFILASFDALAQNVDSNASYFSIGGYWSLATEDPLIVTADPIIDDPIYTAIAMVNPITSSLTIDFRDEIPKERITVAISDTVGYKLLKSSSFVPKNKEHIVSLDWLKPGYYHVVVFSDDKRVLYMGDFAK